MVLDNLLWILKLLLQVPTGFYKSKAKLDKFTQNFFVCDNNNLRKKNNGREQRYSKLIYISH